ncbi:gluconokinase [Microbacterium sp. p3-SID338]|uniref:gluconokinase n=1 Tax=unclassified Microbacterium TaxID=2609290 RepID=UPI000C80EAC5|nr:MULTISPECIES: gluconokinase [unclassified Microbacterium]MCT1395556.1 gluconokinase [Microbacterium sp. p3-SID338]PMC04303.1 gluconate kinase [Microbacterium sp. UMB0228]
MSVRIVVMGPSGSGKSTVGGALADDLGARFVDGDDLHPLTNVEKMAAGTPLDDDDRMPWLRVVGRTLAAETRIVVACSALRRRYRDAIRAEAPDAVFVELGVARETLARRLGDRPEHFMPASLLDSQLDAWEPLRDDEVGLRVDAALPLRREVAAIREALVAITRAPGDAQSLR